MKILNYYASLGGNTGLVAKRIESAARGLGHNVETVVFEKGREVDFMAYDFVFIGTGVYGGLPQGDLLAGLRATMKAYKNGGQIRLGSPRIDKKVVTYCTYGGYFTGEEEAVTTTRVLYTLFDRLGFQRMGDWHIIGECKPEHMQRFNLEGRLGDIRGRPDESDLKAVEERVKGVLASS